MAQTTINIKAHLQSAAAARLRAADEPWGRALSWWRAAADLSPALPLGLAADLGDLLTGVAPPMGDGDAYTAFLGAAAATPAVRAARTLALRDVAVAALLAHLAQAAPIPTEYRLPLGTRPTEVAAALAAALAHPESLPPPSSCLPPPASCLLPILARLQSLAPADVRFVADLGQGILGVADLADLRALTELLSLPALTHALLAEVLAFLPALAEAAPGAALQTYAVDGYGGLARSGSLDAVLPSEWALPSVLLSYRYLNGELLYYGRERPPERRTTLLLLLVQLNDAMAGDLEALVKASALALARAGQARGAVVQVATFDTRLHPPRGLGRPAEVAAWVRQRGQGGADMARVLTQVGAQVRAQAGHYARIELLWLLHAQTGTDHAGAIGVLARSLRGQAGSRALFVSAGAGMARPALAGLLAGRWASVGSAALHDAEERAKAARALRGLARPSERERLAVEAPPTPKRRVVSLPAEPPPDPAQHLLDSGQWEAALAALEPRARAGDETAKLLLAVMIEDGAFVRHRPSIADTLSAIGYRLSAMACPLPLRLKTAALLGEVGDPRLLNPQTGDAPLGGYWCPIDAGPFWCGDDRQGAVRQVTLPYAYRVGRYPVTNAEYRCFIEAGGYQQQQWWTENGWAYLQPGSQRWGEPNETRITLPRLWENASYNQPVVGVSWYEAAAYCAWLTVQGQTAGWLAGTDVIRLPTWLEWERAARGIDQRRYPWGNEPPDAERANYKDTGIGRPTPVGCFPAGAATCGALDLAGNVMEWSATPGDEPELVEARKDFTPNDRILMKYSDYTEKVENLCCGARDWYIPYIWNDFGSFRCFSSRALLE